MSSPPLLAGVALRQQPEGAGKAPQARGMLELSGQGSSHPATYVGHGQRGTVSVARERCPTTHTERLVATKRRRPSAPAHTIEREAEFLGVANRHGIGPRCLGLAEDGESVRYEYVQGMPILDHIQQPAVDKDAVLEILRQIFAQLLCLDRLHLNKHEMTWPAEHILIEAADDRSEEVARAAGAVDGPTRSRPEERSLWRPVLIDFERCTADAAKPRNVTQFLQFLATPTVTKLLKRKRIAVDVPRLRRFGSEYKVKLAALDASTRGTARDWRSDGSRSEAAEWDFIGALGLRDEPMDEVDSSAVASGRAAKKLEAKRMRTCPTEGGCSTDGDLRAAGNSDDEERAPEVQGDSKGRCAAAAKSKDA